MNTTQLLPIAGSIAVVCLGALAAATYVQAGPAADSTGAQADQWSRQQLWNFATANAEGFNSAAATLVDPGVDAVANSR